MLCVSALLIVTDWRSLNHQNSGLLGLNAVSNLYVDETDDVTKRKFAYIAFIHLMNTIFALQSNIDSVAIIASTTASFSCIIIVHRSTIPVEISTIKTNG